MTMILRYLRQMLILAVPAAVAFGCFWPYRKRALAGMGLRTTRWHEAGLLVFIMCTAGILSVTLRPAMYWEPSPGLWGDIRLCIDRPNLLYSVNLVPFRMFADYLEDLRSCGGFFTILNFFGNLCVFVPLGLFPALLFPRESWKKAAATGFGMSLFVECAQYFLGRSSDIDDVILNTAGAILGYGVFCLLRRWFPGAVRAFRCASLENNFEKSETKPAAESSYMV